MLIYKDVYPEVLSRTDEQNKLRISIYMRVQLNKKVLLDSAGLSEFSPRLHHGNNVHLNLVEVEFEG